MAPLVRAAGTRLEAAGGYELENVFPASVII